LSTLRALIALVRPHQWLKNLMLYFPPFLGGTLLTPGTWQRGVLPFIAFSLASSAGYVLNDLMDREWDRRHPRKRTRPIASGEVTPPLAIGMSLLLLLMSLVSSWGTSHEFTILIVAYLLLTISYSLWLKNVPVVDLFCIAAGFILRLEAGGGVFRIPVSEWLFLSVLLLSLFLAAGKRRAEKGIDGGESRKLLSHYPDGFLEGVLVLTGSAALVTYSMYTLSHRHLLTTVPLCCFGLLRYLLRVLSGKGGDPTDALVRDPWLCVVGIAWAGLVAWGLYGG